MTQLLDYDNRDDRQEIRRLLGRMHPMARWTFLEWCTTICKTISGKRPGMMLDHRERERIREAIRSGGHADSSFSDYCFVQLWQLHTAWQLDLDAALAKLVSLARGRESREDVQRLIQCHANQPPNGFGST